MIGGLLTFMIDLAADRRTQRRAESEAKLYGAAVARLVWDELWGIQTVLQEALDCRRWWVPQFDVRVRINSEDYRYLAIAVSDWHHFNSVAMAVRRVRRLAVDREALGSESLQPALDDKSAEHVKDAYDRCDEARKGLKGLSGIGFGEHAVDTHDPLVAQPADAPR
ncbi:MAG: hypothetical protein QOK04_756 [Solirubrobacteraceae bacterium]|nr:hypothetical protein [Solirubrobacteraceae bacterium]